MSTEEDMNEVYNKAKDEGMAVILVLPPDTGHWCGMVDPRFGWSEEESKDEGRKPLFSLASMTQISINDCVVKTNELRWWMTNTMFNIISSVMNDEIRKLYESHELMRPKWCFSGIPQHSRGYLDDHLGIGPNQVWSINNCSVKGMNYALFTKRNEMILAKRRPWNDSFRPDRALFEMLDNFMMIPLPTASLKPEYQIQLASDDEAVSFISVEEVKSEESSTIIDRRSKIRVKCTIAGNSFNVRMNKEGKIPVMYSESPLCEEEFLDRIKHALMKSMKHIKNDLLLESLINAAVESSRFSFIDLGKRQKSLESGRINLTDACISCIESFVYHTISNDFKFISTILGDVKQRFSLVWEDGLRHWTAVLNHDIFSTSIGKVRVFEQCLLFAGKGESKNRYTALKWAISKGDFKLINAAIAHENSLDSQSSLEDAMAAKHSRWTAQCEYFVEEYLMKEEGGFDALDALTRALIKFMNNRGDFTDVDLMGIAFHGEGRQRLLNALKQKVEDVLQYKTLHEHEMDWIWMKNTVLEHPIMLCTTLKENPSDIIDRVPLTPSSGPSPLFSRRPSTELLPTVSERSNLSPRVERDDWLLSDGQSTFLPVTTMYHVPLITEEDKEILYGKIDLHCAFETETAGELIRDSFRVLASDRKSEWDQLTAYQPMTECSGPLRQDAIDKGKKPLYSQKQIREVALQSCAMAFNAETMYDSGSYLSEALIYAHFVQPNFERLMREGLSQYGTVRIASVKEASKVVSKSEEYASDKLDKYCYWPFTARVVDLVRCSVIVEDLSGMMAALKGFEQLIHDYPEYLSLVKCENDFSDYGSGGKKEGLLPDQYCEITFNVACKDSTKKRAVIGEVKFELRPVLDQKTKMNELNEVQRKRDLFDSAKRRLDDEWSFKKQQLLAVNNKDRLYKLLTFLPFQFTLDQTEFQYLFRGDWTNQQLINDTADVIVNRNIPTELESGGEGRKEDEIVKPFIDALTHGFRKVCEEKDPPIGVMRLMCEIIRKVKPDVRHRVKLIRGLLTVKNEYSGNRPCFIRALVGLAPEVKKEIDLKFSLIDPAESFTFTDLTSVQLANVISGWKSISAGDVKWFTRELLASIYLGKRNTDGLTKACEILNTANAAEFMAYVKHIVLNFYSKILPPFMIEMLKEAKKIPGSGLVTSFIMAGFITVADLESSI